MPLSSKLLAKRWSTVNLPILPFLTPRVFQSWPRGCRTHAGTALKTGRDVESNAQNEEPRAKQSDLEDLHNSASGRTSMRSYKPVSGVQLVEGASPNTSDEEEFRKLYENIWSPDQLPKSSPERSLKPIIRSSMDGGRLTRTRRRISRKPTFKSDEIWGRHNTTSTTDMGPQDSGLPDLGSISTNAAEDLRNTTQKMKTPTRKPPFIRKTALRRAAIRHAMLKEDLSISMGNNGIVKKYREFPIRRTFGGAWRALLGMLSFKRVKISGRGTTDRSRLSRQHGCSLDALDLPRLKFEWKKFPLKNRRELFPRMMLTALSASPRMTLNLLSLIYSPEICPNSAVSTRILDYIIVLYLHNKRSRHQSTARHIYLTFISLLSQHPEEKIFLSQRSIQSLIFNLYPKYVYRLYNVLEVQGQSLNGYTLRQFAHAFATFGWNVTTFKVLKRIRAEGYDLNTPSISAICITLLQRKPLDENASPPASPSSSEIFGFLLESGMRPTLTIYTILIQNSIAAGDHETAWKIHDMMLNHGMKPNHFTYSALLNDAKWRMDQPTMKRLIAIIEANDLWDPHLVTDVLHAIFLLRRQEETEKYTKSLSYQPQHSEVFKQMLPVYCKYFQLEPLATIIPLFWETYSEYAPQANGASENDNTVSNQSAEKAKVDLMVATGPPLVVMMAGYLQGISNPHKWYHHFRELVRSGDPAVASLMVKPHVYDMTLMAYSKFPDLVVQCPRIIQNMLYPHMHLDNDNRVGMKKSLNISASIVDTDPTTPESKPLRPDGSHMPPKPDVYTWSVLVKIFMDHKQPRAAEKVITMMQARGIEPNHVTWSTLAAGYARLQSTEMALQTMKRLKTAGHEVNDITLAGLRSISGSKKFRDGMALVEASQPIKGNKDSMKRLDIMLRAEEQLFQEERKYEDVRRPDETLEEFNNRLAQKYPDRFVFYSQRVQKPFRRRAYSRITISRRVKLS